MPTKLADRVAELEREVAELKAIVKSSPDDALKLRQPHPDAWQTTIGAFEGSKMYEDVIKAGRAWRKRQPKV
jgi:hypothetical protein